MFDSAQLLIAAEVQVEVNPIVMLAMFAICFVIAIAGLIGMWKVYEKAGKPGWGAIVPIYNFILLLEIAGKPTWWIILFCIPCVGIVFMLMTYVAVAKNFGKGEAFGLGLGFLPMIFFPILGFGDAKYNPVETSN